MHLFRHDGRAGLSTNGKSTAATGKQIVFFGPSNERDWRVALREILEKVEAKGCRRLALVPWGEHEHAWELGGAGCGSTVAMAS